MKKNIMLLLLLFVWLVGCKSSNKVKTTPSTVATAISPIDISEDILKKESNKEGSFKVSVGSDYAIYVREGVSLKFNNATNEGYFKQNENAIEFILSYDSGCKFIITLEESSLKDIKDEYIEKYGECSIHTESGYTVLGDEGKVRYALKESKGMTIKMEIYNYQKNCVTDIADMISTD